MNSFLTFGVPIVILFIVLSSMKKNTGKGQGSNQIPNQGSGNQNTNTNVPNEDNCYIKNFDFADNDIKTFFKSRDLSKIN